MQGITVRVTLAMLVLMAALLLPSPRAGVAEAPQFDLEKAVTGARTPADHEAIASYYERESATAQAKAAEHRKMEETYRTLSGKGHFRMEEHCHQLVQHYEGLAADNAALAAAHRQMAREATQQKQ